MARETIKELKAEMDQRSAAARRSIEERDQEIGHLRSMLDEAHRRNHELREKLRMVGLIIQDAQER